MPQTKKHTETPASRSRHSWGVVALVFFVGAAIAWVWAGFLVASALSFAPRSEAPEQQTHIPPSETARRFRSLDGVEIPGGKQDPFPVGVMIENLPTVRPQPGLAGASVVYETLAEGGATRFLVLYPGSGGTIQKIGPVRSARPYYVTWDAEYGALYGHAGGSPEGLAQIRDLPIQDLNGIGREAKYFWRDRSISAPHNLFTSSELLARAMRDLALDERAPSFTPWAFQDEPPIDERPKNPSVIRIAFSGKAYETEYRYDRTTNTYLRFNAGVPHLDGNTNTQLAAKNVLVQVIPPIRDIGEKGRLTLDVVGSGRAFLCTNGVMHVGTWTKQDSTARTMFFFEDGSPAVFSRGATWIAVIPEDRVVTYEETPEEAP